MSKQTQWVVMWMAMLILTACGSSEPAAEANGAPEETGGGELAPEPEAEPEETSVEEPAEEAPAAQGPAQLTVVAKIGTAVGSAHVKVLGEDGAVIAEGESGTALTVQSGSVTIEAKVTDAAVMIDTPTVREEVEIAAGDSRTVEVHIPRAQVKVTVSVNGKPDNKATVTLMRHGAVVTTLTSGAPDFVSITPGRYSAKVKAKNAEIEVPDVVIPEDSARNVPLNVTL